MKNKILSLMLVLVIVVLTLASCGQYAYVDDIDALASCSAMNTAALKDALLGIHIEDEAFTASERDAIVITDVMKKLAAAVASDSNAKRDSEYVIKNFDSLTYGYYYTVDGVVSSDMKMTVSGAKSAQLGLSTNDDLVKAIGEKLVGSSFELMSTVTPGKIKVTYDKFVPATEDAEEKWETVTAENVTITEDAEGIAGYLFGKDLAEKVEDNESYRNISVDTSAYHIGAEGDLVLVTYTVDADDKTFTNVPVVISAEGEGIAALLCGKDLSKIENTDDLSSIKVSSVISGDSVEVEYTVEVEDQKTFTDVTGETVTKAENYTAVYHIFPVSIIETPACTLENVLLFYYGNDLKIDTLKVFDEKIDDKAKFSSTTGEGEEAVTTTLKELVEKLVTTDTADGAIKKVLEAKKAYESNEETVENELKTLNDELAALEKDYAEAEEGSDNKNSLAEKIEAKKEEIKNNKKNVYAAEKEAFDAIVADITAMSVTEGEGEDAKTVTAADAIIDELKDTVYDTEIEKYNKAITDKVKKAVWDVIAAIDIDLSKLPEKAVKENVDQLMNNHKGTFYTESDDSKTTYYSKYNANFKAYLMDETDTASYKDAEAAIEKEAREYVADAVRVWIAAKLLGAVYSADDYAAYKKDEDSTYYTKASQGYSDNDMATAQQFDKLLNKILYNGAEEADRTDKDTDEVVFSKYLPSVKSMVSEAK